MRCPLHLAARRFGDAPALIKSITDVSFEPDTATRKPDAVYRFWPGSKSITGWSFQDWDRHAEALRPLVRGQGLLALQDPDNLPSAALLFAALREGRPTLLLSRRLPPAEVKTICTHLGIAALLAGPDIEIPILQPPPVTTPPEIPTGISTILMTSGSSGAPRAVAHTAAAHLANAAGSDQNIPFHTGHVWLRSLSLHHVGGLAMLFRSLHGGGAVAFPEEGVPLGAAAWALSASHLSVVATQLQRLLAEGPPPLSAVLVGGGPIPPVLVDRALAAGMPIHTTYGMTEMGSQVTTTPPEAGVGRLRTAGRPLPGREVCVADDGEILVRGLPLMAGYLLPGGVLDRGCDEEGWYHTGDIGILEDGGWLRVTGRKDLMFISGGENIYPEEIERALMGLDGVSAAVVVSVGDEKWGARPVAFVQGTFEEGVLRAALRERLAGFMVPDRIFAWPDDAPGWSGKPPRRWFTGCARALVG
ncbi:MAG: O-succinylbenzoic acid--CoA ligase [Myxococcota bacterium]|jgi:O-succinylbenzoic acid--CoA ligase